MAGTGIFQMNIVMKMNDEIVNVAGYVKLAKLWEKSRDRIVTYHKKYYEDKYGGLSNVNLVDVYIDITGQKSIRKRPEMIRLIADCKAGKIDIISTQTRAYLAANSGEFCYLIYYLFNLSNTVHIVSEDDNYRIDTIANYENQREALLKMAEDYIKLAPMDYQDWMRDIEREF